MSDDLDRALQLEEERKQKQREFAKMECISFSFILKMIRIMNF